MEKLNSPKGLLVETWRLYRANLAGLIKVSVLPILAVSMLGFLIALLAPAKPSPESLLLLVGVAIIICISLWGQVALLSAVIKTDSAPVNVQEAFRQGWQLLAPFIWVTFLSIIILIPAFALVIIPGIWLAVAFSFTSYILIVENQKGFAAIKASYAYVKNYWFAVAGRLLLLSAILIIPTMILTAPFGKNSPTGSLVNAIISVLVAPYASLYVYGLYKNIKAVKANEPKS